jgi:hypothetical protein
MTIRPSLRSSPFRSHRNCRLTLYVSRPDAYLHFDGCVFRRLGIRFVVQCRLLRAHTIGVLSDRCGINRRRLLGTWLRIIRRYIETGGALDLRLNRDQHIPNSPLAPPNCSNNIFPNFGSGSPTSTVYISFFTWWYIHSPWDALSFLQVFGASVRRATIYRLWCESQTVCGVVCFACIRFGDEEREHD